MRKSLVIVSVLLLVSPAAFSQRKILNIPDIPGYVTLKCDFHMHTVFSDGDVWPVFRVEEAWRDGLDAISITDHIEYQPKVKYVPENQNAAWEIAGARAKERNIVLVHGAEISRSMPPGHLNALFITDANPLDTSDYMAAIEAAVKQGAFIQYNHPGWKAQEPDGIAKLYPVHKELIAKGWLHGIEYFNEFENYRNSMVIEMCRENKLSVMGNSDIHGVISEIYREPRYTHRPVTLVFAKERTPESLREAMFAGRTAVWYGDSLAGFEQFIRPLFDAAVSTGSPFKEDEKNIWFEIRNSSDLNFQLRNGPEGAPADISLPPRSLVVIKANKRYLKEPLGYNVSNVITGSESVLTVSLRPGGGIPLSPKQ